MFSLLHNCILRCTYCQNGVKLKNKMWLHNAQVYGFFFPIFFYTVIFYEQLNLMNTHISAISAFSIYFIQPFVHLLSNNFQWFSTIFGGFEELLFSFYVFSLYFKYTLNCIGSKLQLKINRNCQYFLALRMCNDRFRLRHMCRVYWRSLISFTDRIFHILSAIFSFSHLFDIYNEIDNIIGYWNFDIWTENVNVRIHLI